MTTTTHFAAAQKFVQNLIGTQTRYSAALQYLNDHPDRLAALLADRAAALQEKADREMSATADELAQAMIVTGFKDALEHLNNLTDLQIALIKLTLVQIELEALDPSDAQKNSIVDAIDKLCAMSELI